MRFKLDDIDAKVYEFKDEIADVDALLEVATEYGCSDLYVKVGERPYLRRYGRVIEVPCLPTDESVWGRFHHKGFTSEQNAKYVREKALDFAYKIEVPPHSKYAGEHEYFRYRVSAGFSEGKNIATFRMIRPVMPSFSNINYPSDVVDVLKESFKNKSGIVLFCGATGSGKTTTMASCINDFTKEGQPLDNSVIVTLEDPIEYIYQSTKSVKVFQKELGKDFKSFDSGLKQALREHPDLILCGEIRDAENIKVAIEAARTGHKVVTSFHVSDVPGAVSRLDAYLSVQNKDLIYDLIANIDLVVCQRMTSTTDAFILETQYLFFVPEVVKYLQEVLYKGENVSVNIGKLFEDKSLIERKVLRDWR